MIGDWIRAVQAHWRAPVIGRVWLIEAAIATYSGLIYLFEEHYEHCETDLRSSLHALLGTVLGVLLVFRTNTAYDRWWEGRKLWGQLVNDSRNLCIKARALPKIEAAEMQYFGRLIVNFARALKEHLREGVRPRQLSVYKSVTRTVEPQHVPSDIAAILWERVRGWNDKGWIDQFDLMMFDKQVKSFMDVCGSCERIRKTPISRSYLLFIRQSIGVYVVTLPWGLIHDFRIWTGPAVTIISYFMIGLERIAEDVEEPFGRGEDDLVLDEICNGIEASVTELLQSARGRTMERNIAGARETFG